MKAFPNGVITNDKGVIVGGQEGMDLRDYIAVRAMMALINSDDVKEQCSENEYDSDEWAGFICFCSYKFANAMMIAREITISKEQTDD